MSDASSSSNKPLCNEAAQLVQTVLTAPEPERSDAWQKLVDSCITPMARMVAKRLGFRRLISELGQKEIYEERPILMRKKRNFSPAKYTSYPTEQQEDRPKKRIDSSRIFEDFRDGYEFHIFRKLEEYDPSRARFSTWCYQVLYNWAIDLIRAETSRRKREVLESDFRGPERQEEESAEGGLEELAEASEEPVWEMVAQREALCPRQIEILEKLPVLRRVIACAAAGLVWRIPPTTWRQWVEQAKLDADFPPPELADYDEPLDRLRFLAEYLGASFSSVRQHWYRSLEVLREVFRKGEEE